MRIEATGLVALAVVVGVAASCSSGNGGSGGPDAGPTCDGGSCVAGGDAGGSSSGGGESGADSSSPHDAGLDGTTPHDAGGMDAGEAGPPANGTGTPCSKNADCPSGICQPIGGDAGEGVMKAVCTTTCKAVSDCVAGWTCAPDPPQPSNVCQCDLTAPACDGLDHACSGTPSPVCTSTDAQHPAFCGDGVCHAPAMVATLSTTATVNAYDVTSTEVYWEQTAGGVTQVWSVPLAGGAPSMVVTLPADVPADGILADSAYVYAGRATPANGPPGGAVFTGGGPSSRNISIAANGTETTMFMSPDGGLPPVPTMLFGDGTSVYSCAYSGASFPLTPSLTRTPSATGTPVVLTASCSLSGYAFDSANAYWTAVTNGSPGTTTIHATSLASGGDVTLGSASPAEGTESPMSSNGKVVVLALQGGSSNPLTVYAVPVTGGTPKSIYEGGNANPIVVSADSSFAYLVLTGNFGTTSSVVKIPLGGGTGVTIGNGLLGSTSANTGYTFTPGTLYWLETSGTTTTVWSLNL